MMPEAKRGRSAGSRLDPPRSAVVIALALGILCRFAGSADAQIFRKDGPAPSRDSTESAPRPARTIEVTLNLRSGGRLTGLVVDHDDRAVVVVSERTPYAIAWSEVKTQSAFDAMYRLHILKNGDQPLGAEDHFELGLFALARGRRDLADGQFRAARRIDPAMESRIREATDRVKEQRMRGAREADEFDDATDAEPGPAPSDEGLSRRVVAGLGTEGAGSSGAELTAEDRERVMAVYRGFGEAAREHVFADLTLLETDHFLIWTDWEPESRDKLVQWCEKMYAALCRQFGIDAGQQVFLAKCPIFCWRHAGRFRKFARLFDEYDGTGAVGYTRSSAETGHVHVVLLRQGRGADDYDRFAATLVHEGTHAFIHRLYTTRLIPHWVNEGYAELMTQRVLGERCDNDAKAKLLARQFVRYDWPVADMIADAGPIEVHRYPLAHSLVSYLEGRGPRRFAAFIRRLKEGESLGDALAHSFDGLTAARLESDWRDAVRRADPYSGR